MANGYSALDYVLAGLSGASRGYDVYRERKAEQEKEDKLREEREAARKLEAERYESARKLEAERYAASEARENQRIMLDLLDRGWMKGIQHKTPDIPNAPRGGMPDFVPPEGNQAALQRALQEAGKTVVDVGGVQMQRGRTPEVERQIAMFDYRRTMAEEERQKRAEEERKIAAMVAAGVPLAEATSRVIAGYGGPTPARTGTGSDKDAIRERAMLNLLSLLSKGKEDPLTGEITPYDLAEEQALIAQAERVINAMSGGTTPDFRSDFEAEERAAGAGGPSAATPPAMNVLNVPAFGGGPDAQPPLRQGVQPTTRPAPGSVEELKQERDQLVQIAQGLRTTTGERFGARFGTAGQRTREAATLQKAQQFREIVRRINDLNTRIASMERQSSGGAQ